MKLRVREVFWPAVVVWARNVWVLSCIQFLVMVPLFALQYAAGWVLDRTNALTIGFFSLNNFVHYLLGQATLPVASGLIVAGVFEAMAGRPIRPSASSAALKRLPALCLAAFLMSCLTFVGFLALFVPGLFVICMLWVATPALVMERRSAWETLRRSRELTAGSKWTIFLVYLLMVVAMFVVEWVAYDSVLPFAAMLSPIVFHAVSWIGAAIGGSFFPVLVCVTYYHLSERARQQQASEVFE